MTTAPEDTTTDDQLDNSGWIKLHRSILEWEWWGDPNTRGVFLTMLLLANHKPKRWQGMTIERGSFISSFDHLSDLCRCTIQQLRTCLSHLQQTGEITRKSTNRFTLFSVTNYETYQVREEPSNKQITNEQQTTNKQSTTTKNDKNIRKDNTEREFPFWLEKRHLIEPLERAIILWTANLEKHSRSYDEIQLDAHLIQYGNDQVSLARDMAYSAANRFKTVCRASPDGNGIPMRGTGRQTLEEKMRLIREG